MAMQRQTVLETPFASLWYYPAERIVHHEIHKYIFGAAFRELLLTGAEVLKANGAQKWVSDDRNGGAIRGEDKAWADEHWRPMVVRAGWKTWAIVQPEAIVGQMNIRRIVQEHRAVGLDVRIFTSPDEALTWIVTR